jgi:hypothetical protein
MVLAERERLADRREVNVTDRTKADSAVRRLRHEQLAHCPRLNQAKVFRQVAIQRLDGAQVCYEQEPERGRVVQRRVPPDVDAAVDAVSSQR